MSFLEVQIGERVLSKANKPYVVAELSANHGNNLNTALRTVEAAYEAGADAIKLQTYTADTITINHKSDLFKIDQGTSWDGQYLYDLYKEAHLPWEWHEAIFQKAQTLGIHCFSSPFDKSAVDFLNRFKPPAYKIASFEITDIPLIEYVASKGKPVIISTGIASSKDIDLALEACKKMGNHEIVLLKCTSAYPAPLHALQLNLIQGMKKRFGTPIGLSDHSLGSLAPVIATALGAVFIEKHFILDKSIGGPDAHFSLDPKEFREMVHQISQAYEALGAPPSERFPEPKRLSQFARSLFVVKDVKAGETVTEFNVRSIRPSYGLAPKHYHEILGKKFSVDVPFGTPLSLDHIKS